MDEDRLPAEWEEKIADAEGRDRYVAVRIRTILRIATAAFLLIVMGSAAYALVVDPSDATTWALAAGSVGTGATGTGLVVLERRMAQRRVTRSATGPAGSS